MVSVGRHENIELLAYSEVESVSGYVGNFDISIRRKPRFIDPEECTGCGDCAEVCPVDLLSEFDLGLSTRKAAYRNSPQAVPNVFTIDKKGIAPCRDACPADQRAMGYVSLVEEGRYADAYWAIRRENPFPSVCGRVCNRTCETACSRSEVDQPVNIMGIKRFVADWAYDHREDLAQMQDKSLTGTPFQKEPEPTGKRIAVIGAGPAGLTAAQDLVHLGHFVKVFDALPEAGGMIRVGIPPHRLPYDRLEWEVQQILEEGVELELNTWVDDIPGLLDDGYDAVLLATGAHRAYKINIPNADHPDNWLSLDLLKKACLGQEMDLSGRKIIVLGGGDVAMDAARVAVRLGNPEVKIVCRGMRAAEHEIREAEEEDIEIIRGRVFQKIALEDDRISGVECLKADVGEVIDGKRQFSKLPGTEHNIEGDLVIWALGQEPDTSFLPDDADWIDEDSYGMNTDEEMMTPMKGVFSAGDLRMGATTFVVDAIGEGHHAARCIDRYLRGNEGLEEPPEMPVATLSEEEIKQKMGQGPFSDAERASMGAIPPQERIHNFNEVQVGLTEEEARREAERCLQCGVCAECLECVAACDRDAIHHTMQPEFKKVSVGTIILATGFQDFDPAQAPEYGYGRVDNVLSAMEFERLINSSGPTNGKVLLKNGEAPESVAIVHCVGSRDEDYHKYCSRACCMYSLKFAQLVHDYVDAEVHEIYRDMRTFGKDYEEFYNRTKKQDGVHFYHGRVDTIQRHNGQVRVHWQESFYDQPDHVEVDMVILATGFEPRDDAGQVAQTFGISRSPDGFFREKHPKLAPVETASEGIYLAGACQSPKDIPDSVSQAGGAAAVALSLIDQGTIALHPSIAAVASKHCAGCGQCAAACPYDAITLEEEVAQVNTYNCKGCGTCAAACPNKAITLIHYNDEQLISELRGALS